MKNLRDIAIRFRIDPIGLKSRFVPIDIVIKVLQKISKSYENFLQVEFLKVDEYRKIYEEKPELLKTLLSDLKLNIVDLSYSSFEAAAAPNIIDSNIPLFDTEYTDWKHGVYHQYKDDIISGDFANQKYINSIAPRYSESERKSIYGPLFEATGDQKKYKIHLLDENHKPIRTIVKPESNTVKFYTKGSSLKKQILEKDFKVVKIIAKVNAEDVSTSLKKANIKEFLYQKELEHEAYPFKTDKIRFGNTTYHLIHEIECEVNYDDEQNYIIEFSLLDISVWADTRDKVKEAFSFAFHADYTNYVLENDENLSPKAIEHKAKIISLVSEITTE